MFAKDEREKKNNTATTIRILILCFNANKHFYCLQMDSSSNAILSS